MDRKLKKVKWDPPGHWLRISTMDMHTGGEPLRILLDGYPEIKGGSVLEMRKYFRDHLDHIRKGLMWEPRGHADMYGAVLTRPFTKEADFGTFFLHNEGYSTMCGHAIIALTKFVLDTGLIEIAGDAPQVIIDAPPGQIVSTGFREQGIVHSISFKNVPSFVLSRDQQVEVPGLGKVQYDVAYGGAFYAIVDADRLNISMEPSGVNRMIETGMQIKHSVIKKQQINHPFEPDLSFLYGTIFTGKAHHPSRDSRNVCIFADGEVDRSATGSGVSARAALHFARAELKMGQSMMIESILGTTMEVRVAELTRFGPHEAVIPEVTGSASFTGRNSFCFDPEDPLKEGFFFR
ncbi:MAG: proline racemase family protein [Bacteroidales bacterium]|nr:proline racemase family protein [Bacteroidales bacterium]